MSINKITAERNQRTLLELASQPGNDICADCKTRNPRWASYNLGIFICVNCASIHRKMGTHISKVKSLTLDTWTKDQVEFMKSTGNIKSNAHYNPDENKHPPPTNMIDAERDSDLEKYIRSKYQYKSFVTRSAQVAALLGPSRSAADRLASSPARSQTLPPSASTTTPSSSKVNAAPALPSTAPSNASTTVDSLRAQSQIRSVSQPVAAPATGQAQQQRPATQPPQQQPPNPILNDLAQLQAPAASSSLPLQYASPAMTQPISMSASHFTGLAAPNHFSGLSVSPNNPFPSHLAQQQPTGAFPGGTPRSMSLNTGLSSMNMSGLSPGMTGTSPSMYQPQPTQGGLSTSTPFMPQNTTPSPNPFGPQSLTPSNLGVQQPFAPSSFGQQSMLSAQPQGSPMIPTQPMPQHSPLVSTQPMPQGSPMFHSQQLGAMQGSPMFPTQQTLGQPQMQMQMQMQMGNPFMQNQPQQAQYGTSAQQFLQQMQPHAQQQQQPAYGQPSGFGGTSWQQTGFQGQQQWGGL